MSSEKKLSFDELIAEPDMQYDEVETPRGIVKLGTCSSADILEWFDENDDKEKRKLAGLRLLVKSIVNPDGSRIGNGARDKTDLDNIRETAVIAMSRRDSKENSMLVHRALLLNGLRAKTGEEALTKNVSSGAKSDASLIASGSPSVN